MTILVTGGAGYIGSHTAHLLAELGRDVVVLDTLERGYRDAVGDLDLVIGDIADDRVVAKTCRKYDVDSVIHFAAYKAVGESVSQPLKYYKNNVSGTIALVETLIANGVNRIVFSSSAAVYGTPDSSPVNEDAPLRHRAPTRNPKPMSSTSFAHATPPGCDQCVCVTSTRQAPTIRAIWEKTFR